MRISSLIAFALLASTSQAATWESEVGGSMQSRSSALLTFHDGTPLPNTGSASARTLITRGNEFELLGVANIGAVATPIVDPEPVFITFLYGSQRGGPSFTPVTGTLGQPTLISGVPIEVWAATGTGVELGSVKSILPDTSAVFDFTPPQVAFTGLLNSSEIRWENLGIELRNDTTNDLIATLDTLSFQYINQQMRNVVPEPSSWVLLVVWVAAGVRRQSCGFSGQS